MKSFDGLDADEARRALELVKNLDDKRLIDAGEVEKVKAEARKALDEQLAQKTPKSKRLMMTTEVRLLAVSLLVQVLSRIRPCYRLILPKMRLGDILIW